MGKKPLLLVLLMVTVAFAGCSDGGSSSVDDDDQLIDTPPTQKGKGVIVGVVVDGAINPVEGATVALQGQDKETETNENGAFAFADLEPGSYFLKVTKPGYGDVQQSVEVVADVKSPPTIKVLLERLPGTEPYVMDFVFEGFLECAVGIADTPATIGSSGFNLCSASENNQNTMEHEIEAGATLVQSEMVWGSTSSADSLLISHAVTDASHADGQNDYTQAEGQSPLVIASNGTVLDSLSVPEENPLRIRVFPAGGDAATVHTNRDFKVYTYAFYNFLPEDGWTFGNDGAPEVPE